MKKTDVDLATLGVSSLIAHAIPLRRAGDPMIAIPVSQVVPKMEAKSLAFFRDRLKVTLARQGQIVEVDPTLVGSFLPPEIRRWLEASKPDLLGLSQGAAQHLYTNQSASQKDSWLAAATAKLGGARALALMKLPPEAGIQWRRVTLDGKVTLDVTVLDDLTLTEHSRVFKAGLFWLEGSRLRGLVSDEQQNAPTDISDFFLVKFLGFRRTREPNVLTQMFKVAATEFINKHVDDEEEKLGYFSALHVELRSHATRIEPAVFAQTHLAQEHRAQFLEVLAKHEVPDAGFRKDKSLLPREGRGGRVYTKNGLTISGDAEAIEERVRSAEVDNKRVIVIDDTLTSVT